jgi:flagellin-like hook-associated protein FlgL
LRSKKLLSGYLSYSPNFAYNTYIVTNKGISEVISSLHNALSQAARLLASQGSFVIELTYSQSMNEVITLSCSEIKYRLRNTETDRLVCILPDILILVQLLKKSDQILKTEKKLLLLGVWVLQRGAP